MKKFVTVLLIIVLLLSLSACQTYLFGEYVNTEQGKKYEFINNEFTLTQDDTKITGTYTIKKGNITFKIEGEETTYSYGREGTSAVIDGTVYLRVQ